MNVGENGWSRGRYHFCKRLRYDIWYIAKKIIYQVWYDMIRYHIISYGGSYHMHMISIWYKRKPRRWVKSTSYVTSYVLDNIEPSKKSDRLSTLHHCCRRVVHLPCAVAPLALSAPSRSSSSSRSCRLPGGRPQPQIMCTTRARPSTEHGRSPSETILSMDLAESKPSKTPWSASEARGGDELVDPSTIDGATSGLCTRKGGPT